MHPSPPENLQFSSSQVRPAIVIGPLASPIADLEPSACREKKPTPYKRQISPILSAFCLDWGPRIPPSQCLFSSAPLRDPALIICGASQLGAREASRSRAAIPMGNFCLHVQSSNFPGSPRVPSATSIFSSRSRFSLRLRPPKPKPRDESQSQARLTGASARLSHAMLPQRYMSGPSIATQAAPPAPGLSLHGALAHLGRYNRPRAPGLSRPLT